MGEQQQTERNNSGYEQGEPLEMNQERAREAAAAAANNAQNGRR